MWWCFFFQMLSAQESVARVIAASHRRQVVRQWAFLSALLAGWWRFFSKQWLLVSAALIVGTVLLVLSGWLGGESWWSGPGVFSLLRHLPQRRVRKDGGAAATPIGAGCGCDGKLKFADLHWTACKNMVIFSSVFAKGLLRGVKHKVTSGVSLKLLLSWWQHKERCVHFLRLSGKAWLSGRIAGAALSDPGEATCVSGHVGKITRWRDAISTTRCSPDYQQIHSICWQCALNLEILTMLHLFFYSFFLHLTHGYRLIPKWIPCFRQIPTHNRS